MRRSPTRTKKRKGPYRAKLDAIIAEFVADVVDAVRRSLEQEEKHEADDALLARRFGERRLLSLQRAISWQLRVESGRVRSIEDIARRAGTQPANVTRWLQRLDGLAGGSATPNETPAVVAKKRLPTMAVAYRGPLPPYRDLRNRSLRDFEREYVLAALRATSGNVSMAARIARIDRKHLWRLIRRTGART